MAEKSEVNCDIELVQRCLEGDPQAIIEAAEHFLPYLRSFLRHRGASESEIEDLITTVWSDCLVGDGKHIALFEKFDGQSPLKPWLTAIAANRWISLKRREQVRTKAIEHLRAAEGSRSESNIFTPFDQELVVIIEKAIRRAFSECDAEGLVMLQLIHLHNLSRKEIAALWASHESTISRRLGSTQAEISESIYRSIKELDPWYDLSWEDVLLFTESAQFLNKRC